MTGRLASLFVILACAMGVGGCADLERMRPGMGPGHQLVNQAVIGLTSFAPEDFPSLGPSLRDACAAMILPKVTAASFGLGGAHGKGVLMVRGATDGAWHGPVFVSVSELDAGVQAATSTRELIVVMHSCTALTGLYGRTASLHGGALLADQAGERGSERVVGKSVQVYARMHGAALDAALDATMLRVDAGLAEDFYGTSMSAEQILATDPEGDPIAIEIRRALAYAAR
jgi:lipid-binding SYLF domain-containing protein